MPKVNIDNSLFNCRITLEKLFSNSFLSEKTSFNSLDDMFSSCGFEINSPEDFYNIPDDKWDSFIQKNSDFENWSQMCIAAQEYLLRSHNYQKPSHLELI